MRNENSSVLKPPPDPVIVRRFQGSYGAEALAGSRGNPPITRVAKVHRPSMKKRKVGQSPKFLQTVPISGAPSPRKKPVYALKATLSSENLDRRNSVAGEGGIRTLGTVQDLQGEIVCGSGSLFGLIITVKVDREFLRLRFG